mgnify:CR=1 FL=1
MENQNTNTMENTSNHPKFRQINEAFIYATQNGLTGDVTFLLEDVEEEVEAKMKHLEQLELWWGEAADSFPGSFASWLLERIESEESEDIDADIECLVYELRKNRNI